MDNLWLSLEFYEDAKTIRLIDELGCESIVCLQKLWIRATKYAIRKLLEKKDIGLLDAESENEIEKFSGWFGEPGKLSGYLLEKKWIEKKHGKFYIHDLDDNSGYIFNYINSKVNGSKYAKIRWEENKKKKAANGVPNGGAIGVPNGKVREGKVREGNKEKDKKENVVIEEEISSRFDSNLVSYMEVLKAFKEITGKKFTPTNKVQALISDRSLKDGHNMEAFKTVITNVNNQYKDDKKWASHWINPHTCFKEKEFDQFLNLNNGTAKEIYI